MIWTLSPHSLFGSALRRNVCLRHSLVCEHFLSCEHTNPKFVRLNFCLGSSARCTSGPQAPPPSLPPPTSSMHEDVLLQELANIDGTQRALRQDLQLLRARRKKQKHREKKSTENFRRLCLTVYLVSHWNMAAAVDVLDLERRRFRAAQLPRACAEACVEHWFLEASPRDVAAWATPVASDAAAQRRLRLAEQFFVDWQLKEWVLQENLQRGVAPTSARLLRQAYALKHGVRPARFDVGAMSSRERLWARRWRCRWGAAWTSIQARESCPIQELRQKAWARMCMRASQRMRQLSLAKTA